MTSIKSWRRESFIICPAFAIPLRYFAMAIGVVGVSTIKSGMALLISSLEELSNSSSRERSWGEAIPVVAIIMSCGAVFISILGMTLYENGKEQRKYENYTTLSCIKEEAGGIWEVEMRQSSADTDARLAELEEKAEQQEGDIEQLKREVEEGSAGVDRELFAATAVVARANAQALSDMAALEAKVLYPDWNPNSIEYTTGFKVLYEDILYKCISEHTSQASWAPGAAPSLWTAIESGERAGTLKDPIPVPDTVTTAGMEYEKGKYYSEGDTVYLMDRQGMDDGEKVTLYFAPSALAGQYFSAAE